MPSDFANMQMWTCMLKDHGLLHVGYQTTSFHYLLLFSRHAPCLLLPSVTFSYLIFLFCLTISISSHIWILYLFSYPVTFLSLTDTVSLDYYSSPLIFSPLFKVFFIYVLHLFSFMRPRNYLKPLYYQIVSYLCPLSCFLSSTSPPMHPCLYMYINNTLLSLFAHL